MNGPNVRTPPRPEKQRSLLRAHKRACLLLAFYIPLVLIPWIITVVLAHRPLTKSSWTYAPGFSYKDYKLMQGWAKAIPILNAVAAIIAIPITSAIIAQAAVVFAQRRYPGQQLSVKHMFSLADRAWCDWGSLFNTWDWEERGSAQVKRFLFAGAGLVIFGAVPYPLYQILAPWKEITIPTCKDTRYIRVDGYGVASCDFDHQTTYGYTKVGSDLEPAQMANIPAFSVLPRIVRDLAVESDRQLQPHLWNEADTYGYRSPANFRNLDGFVAGLPSGTTTGVLREHIMRFNSSVSCANISTADYPSTCSGKTPFQASFKYDESYHPDNNATVDICAPGELGKYPWTLSRNRQELTEEVFLKLTGTRQENEVIHCKAQTTRGYFELGNVHNGGANGPLLENWPSKGPPLDDYQYNDYTASQYSALDHMSAYIPSEEDHHIGGATPVPDPRTDFDDPVTYTNMSGPLMTSVLALFGTDSWVHSVRNLTSGKDEDTLDASNANQMSLLQPLCDQAPFRRASLSMHSNYYQAYCTRSLYGLRRTYSDSLAEWNRNDTVEDRLNFAMFLANRAALTSHTLDLLPWYDDVGRTIYTAPGMATSKPDVSLPAQVVLSFIVGVQVLGLLWLGYWMYMWPAWTRTLDAMAVARIAASLDPSLLPPFKIVGLRETKKLSHTDGLVGTQVIEEIVEQHHETVAEPDIELAEIEQVEFNDDGSTVGKGAANSVVSVAPPSGGTVTLGLGALGVITKRGARKAPVASQGVDV